MPAHPISPNRPAALRPKVRTITDLPRTVEPGPALALVTLIARLAELGIDWRFDGEALLIFAPGGTLTPGLERAIAHHWDDLALYAEPITPGMWTSCPTCGGNQFWEWTDEPGLHCQTCAPRHRATAPPRPYATLAHRDGRRFR